MFAKTVIAFFYHEITSKVFILLCLSPIIIFVWMSGIFSIEDPVRTIFNCGDPCIVKFSGGGSVPLFLYATKRVSEGDRSYVAIDGECASACNILVDFAREKVCMTKNARFSFHQWHISFGFYGFQFAPIHSDDVRDIVEKNGGFPRETFVSIPAEKFQHILPWCPSIIVPLPIPDPRRSRGGFSFFTSTLC